MNSRPPLTFASVPYANAAILTAPIRQAYPDCRLRLELPVRLRSLLLTGDADAALVPVVDYLMADDLVPVGDVGIAADGPVESVLLKCRKPLADIHSVHFDPASRTSNVLTEILLRQHWSQTFNEGHANADAAVTIGDRALLAPPATDDRDLAEAWHDLTGLPFVFAIWACRDDHPNRADMAEMLQTALEAGRQSVDSLATEQDTRLGLCVERSLHYMTHSIRYEIGEREKRAIHTFADLIHRHADRLLSLRTGDEVRS